MADRQTHPLHGQGLSFLYFCPTQGLEGWRLASWSGQWLPPVLPYWLGFSAIIRASNLH
jgi:hypothetical protein